MGTTDDDRLTEVWINVRRVENGRVAGQHHDMGMGLDPQRTFPLATVDYESWALDVCRIAADEDGGWPLGVYQLEVWTGSERSGSKLGEVGFKWGVHRVDVTMPECSTETQYTCPECDRTSHNPNDAENRYCGHCHQFEDAPVEPSDPRSEDGGPALGWTPRGGGHSI